MDIPEGSHRSRRHFLGAATAAVAAAELGLTAPAQGRSGEEKPEVPPTAEPGANKSFSSLKQKAAGVLNVGYAEAAPRTDAPSFFCTAGPTTSTAMSTSRLCWRRRATE